jgi:hypothetical protein
MSMQKLFSNLLVPVSFNRYTCQSVENAIALANRLECNLHILYTLRTNVFRGWFHSQRKKRVSDIQQQMRARVKPGLLMQAVFTEGSPYDEVKNYVLSQEIDLVWVQRQTQPFWSSTFGFDPEKLAVEADCAVISDHGSEGLKNCDKIILPVGPSVPVNGVRVAVYLARQFKASIHLVCDTFQEEQLASLQRTYHLLNDNTDITVVCNTFHNSNFHRSVLNYAQSVEAGIIVANPAYRKKENVFGKWIRRENGGSVAVVMVD